MSQNVLTIINAAFGIAEFFQNLDQIFRVIRVKISGMNMKKISLLRTITKKLFHLL